MKENNCRGMNFYRDEREELERNEFYDKEERENLKMDDWIKRDEREDLEKDELNKEGWKRGIGNEWIL